MMGAGNNNHYRRPVVPCIIHVIFIASTTPEKGRKYNQAGDGRKFTKKIKTRGAFLEVMGSLWLTLLIYVEGFLVDQPNGLFFNTRETSILCVDVEFDSFYFFGS